MSRTDVILDAGSPAQDPGAGKSESSNARSIQRLLQRIAFWCVIATVALFALAAGLMLRRYAWDQTEPIRFTADIDNAFRQGSGALQTGYLDRYDQQVAASPVEGNYELDYGPARLVIATLWVRWVKEQIPVLQQDWRRGFYAEAVRHNRQYQFCRPLLIINTVGEIVSAIAMFLLVRRWTSRRQKIYPDAHKPSAFNVYRSELSRPVVLGLLAALLFWFNPALISNAHCWPQWDSWVLPFFLWALVAASYDAWFCAGLCIAVGMMFKGQILFGAPLFLLWPLFRGQLMAIVHWIAGLAIGTAAITAVWLVRTDQQVNGAAITWVLGMAIAAIVIALLLRLRWVWYAKLPVTIAAVGLVMWPFVQLPWPWLAGAIVALIGMSLLLRCLPLRHLPFVTATWVAAALLLCVPIFNGSAAWFEISVAYGTRHYMRMGSGPNNNLAEILADDYHWDDPMETVYTLPPNLPTNRFKFTNWVGQALSSVDRRIEFKPGQPLDIPLKYLLVSLWVLATLGSAIGAAIHSRSNSPRFLVAIAAPWVVFFTVMTQMHQRYLLWGATLSAGAAAVNPGFFLLHLLVTAIAWSQEFQTMMMSRGHTNALLEFIKGWHPGIGWALLLIAAIFTYVGMMPERRRRQLPG